MKKLKGLFLMTPLLLTGCGDNRVGVVKAGSGDEYQLTISNEYSEYTHDIPEPGKYAAGTKFEFSIDIIYDWGVYPFSDDFEIEYLDKHDEEYNYNYYQFVMPEKDSELVIAPNRYYKEKDYDVEEVIYNFRDLTVDDIISIEITTYTSGMINLGGASDTDIVERSANKEDIAYNFNCFKGKKFRKATSEDNRSTEAIKRIKFSYKSKYGENYFDFYMMGSMYVQLGCFGSCPSFVLTGNNPDLPKIKFLSPLVEE